MAVMMALGGFRFEISTAAYQDLERSDEYRWVSQERIGRHPAMQFIGAGHTSFTLSGTIFPHFRGGLEQVGEMRAMAGRGAPLRMVSGRGRILGQFVIMKITETESVHFSNGAPRRIDFSMELKSYGSD